MAHKQFLCTEFFPGILVRDRRVMGGLLVLLLASSVMSAEPLTKRPPWTASRLVGTPVPPDPFRVVSAFPGVRFEKPTSLEEIPGTNRLLITEIGGRIFSLPKVADVAQADLVVDLKELLPKELVGKGVSLFDAEFHPKFHENQRLFVCYVHPGDGGPGDGSQTRVSQFKLNRQSPPGIVPNSEEVIITWPSGGHNGGCLEFGTDGHLYISTGDGSGPNPPDGLTTGQDVSDLLGAILRIDVDHPGTDGKTPRLYSIPKDNPFVEMAGARGEIWSYGLRNPWKFGVDIANGEIFVADNGWESWEMIHRVERGRNCGWPTMEGRAALRTEVKPGPTPIVPPVMDHPHTEANSVIGGTVYRGDKLSGLIGEFVYGDYITGTIWAIRHESDDSYSHRTLLDTDLRIVAFTQGSGGELFVLDYDVTGQIYELLPSNRKDNSAHFPRRLSETGLFTSLDNLSPAPGVVPYEVQVGRWMDGAVAQRWIAIPGDGTVALSADEKSLDRSTLNRQGSSAKFPEGSVLVKHLTLPRGEGDASPGAPPTAVRLETQILHFEHDTWQPYSYLWNDAGTEAYLVDSMGATRTLQVADPATKGGLTDRTWHVNASNECKLCHNAGPGYVLGFVAHQLNHTRVDTATSPLKSLEALGVLDPAPPIAAEDPCTLVDPFDNNHSLEARARSYLHVNCAMCHHPGGNAIVSFYLRRDLPFDKLNTNKGTGIGTFGMRNAKIIAPGDPYRSVLMYRMSKLGYARMPYIGSRTVDSAGVALIEQWIRTMPAQDASSSAIVQSDSAEAGALRTLRESPSVSRDVRDRAIGELLKSTEGTLALIAMLHRGDLTPPDKTTVLTAGRATPSSDIRGLLETFIPKSQRRATLGTRVAPKTILDRQGDVARGKLIFFSDGARCRACHDIDDAAKSLGPTLKEVNKKYPRPAEMLQHVLQPSLKVDEPFVAYVVQTDDGQVIQGLLAEKSDNEVVIKTAEKRVVRVPRNRIDVLEKSVKSLMPDSILSDLTAQEAADLLEYLRSLGAAK